MLHLPPRPRSLSAAPGGLYTERKDLNSIEILGFSFLPTDVLPNPAVHTDVRFGEDLLFFAVERLS